MPSTPQSLLNYLRVVVGAWRDDPRDDAALLARFVESSDETAFRVLVCRYGPLVWRICRHILGDTPDAEDAFQTAFLSLARTASRLRHEPLDGWLYRVARRAAINVRSKSQRTQDLERRLRAVLKPKLEDNPGRADLYAALDEELMGLPERLRVPLLLHYLEGRSQVEVARFLGCARSILQKRLTQGEAILRKRLERRGLAGGVVSVSALLGSAAGAPAVPARLIGSTVRAALRSLSFPLESSGSAALAEGVLKSMLVTKTKIATVLLGLTLCLVGGGLLAYQALAGNASEPPQPAGESRGKVEAPRQPGVATRVDCFGDPLPAHALARMGTVRLWQAGDPGGPKALAFSPDGKTLAGHINGMTVCLWDAATGKEIRRLTTKAVKGDRRRGEGWLPPIVSLGFSPDGKILVAMNCVQTVCRWEVATGKFLRKQEYQGPKRDNVQSLTVAFLPNGQMLGFGEFAAEGRRGMYVWDVATGKEICQLGGLREKPLAARAFSPDGKLLATVTEGEKIIHLWNIATGKEICQLTGEKERSVYSVVAFSADGKTLAAAAIGQKNICMWEVATGKLTHLLEVEGGMNFDGPLTYSPDGKTLLAGAKGPLFDVGTGKRIRSFGCENGMVALFSPDGKVLAMGDEARAIRLWEVATGKEIGPRKGFRGRIQSVAYSPDGKTLASIGEDRTVRLWEAATGKEIRPLAKHRWGIGSIAYSPDGKMLVSMDTELHLWDTATGKEIRQFRCEGIPQSATFSSDSKKLAASIKKDDELVRLWEVATGKEIYTLKTGLQHGGPLEVSFSPDGRLLAAPGKENTVSLWEVATGQPIGQLAGTKPPGIRGDQLLVLSLAFSPDGRMLATSSRWDEKIRVWEVTSGKEIWQLDSWQVNGRETHPGGYSTLAFSPDSSVLATAALGANHFGGSFDPKVHLWDVASGKEIGQLAGHQAPVRTIAFSPDGKTLASGGEDLTCLIWDLTSMNRLKPVPALPLAPRVLSPEQLEAAWADLAKEPTKAYAALGALQAVPTQAIALLQARIRPVAPLTNPQQLRRWIADLDDSSFTVRDRAQRGIEKLGEVAGPTLRQALEGRPPAEVRRRLKDLLVSLEPQLVTVSPNRLRELRAVQALEYIGTVKAQQVLQVLAKGIAGARLTMEAKAALARLAKRSAARP